MRHLIFVCLLLFSSFASATTYYWDNSSFYNPGQYPSASSACQAISQGTWEAKVRNGDTNGYRLESPELTVNGDRAYCGVRIYSSWTGDYQGSAYNLQRYGDSCPQSETYNSSDGSCGCPSGQVKDIETGLCGVPNQCTSLKNQSRTFQKTGVAPDDFFNISSSKRPAPVSRNACFEGCAAEMTDMRCTHKTTGSYKCKIEASFTGDTCGAGGTGPEESSVPSPDPQVDTSKEPCVYKTAPDGTQSCVSSSVFDKEGQNCGDFNGKQVCVDKNANKNEVKVKTDVKTESTPDGGTKITKTDTVTVTSCTGVNSCSTTVSTNTSTTTKDSNGNTTGSSSSCIGPSCAGNTTGGSDSNGDGIEDCVTDCGEGGGGGDPELEEVSGFGDSTKKFVDRVEGSNIAQSLSTIRAPSGGQCYAPSADTVVLGEIKFDGHCQVLDGNRNLIKLLAKTLWAMAAVAVFFW